MNEDKKEEHPFILNNDILGVITEYITSPYYDSRKTFINWYCTNKEIYNKRKSITIVLKIWQSKLEQVQLKLLKKQDGATAMMYNGYMKDIAILTHVCCIQDELSVILKKCVDEKKMIEEKYVMGSLSDIDPATLTSINIIIKSNNWYLQFMSNGHSVLGSVKPKVYLCLLRSK